MPLNKQRQVTYLRTKISFRGSTLFARISHYSSRFLPTSRLGAPCPRKAVSFTFYPVRLSAPRALCTAYTDYLSSRYGHLFYTHIIFSPENLSTVLNDFFIFFAGKDFRTIAKAAAHKSISDLNEILPP